MKTGFFDIENWREIGVTLARNKTRTFLTAFGIFWGTAMLAMLIGGTKGLELMIRKNFDGYATNSAVLAPNRRTISFQGFNKGTTWSLTNADIQAIRKIPGIDAVAPTTSAGTINVSSGKYNTTATISGVDQDYVKVFLPIVYQGRFINEADNTQRSKNVIIGRNIANKLFPQGDALGQFINLSGIYYKVIGLAYQESEISVNNAKVDDQVIMPISTLVQAFNLGDNVGSAMLTALPGHKPGELKPRIHRAIRVNHPIDPADEQAVFFFDVSEHFEMTDNLFLGITLLAFFVGIGTLIAGIIGVGNIMWVIVKERTNEIGIRRAIGARPIDIVTQILSEGVALTSIAGIAGISFATIVLAITTKMLDTDFEMSFTQAIYIMVIFMVLGIIASIIPSLKSMKIKPIEAINDK